MRTIRCPNCGKIVEANTYCPNCGYNVQNVPPLSQTQSVQSQAQQPAQPQPRTSRYDYYGYRRSNSHHKHPIVKTIACLIVLAVGGTYLIGAHANHDWSFNENNTQPKVEQHTQTSPKPKVNNSKTSKPKAKPKKQVTKVTKSKPSNQGSSTSKEKNKITTLWSNIESSLQDNGSKSIAKLFANGSQNKYFKQVKAWEDEVDNADSNNDTDVISIKPSNIDINNGNATYNVTYNFKIHNGSKTYNHIQVFNWTAKFNKSGKIVKTNSPKKPIKDYKK